MTNKLGQYFTTDSDLKEAVVVFCANPRKSRMPILEPSAGKGDLVKAMHAAFPRSPTHAVEIDPSLGAGPCRDKKDTWLCADFLGCALPRKTYKTIVGNPPYVRTGGTNLYLQFIERCVHLLSKGGELVFVLPLDFFRLTSAANLITSMCQNGAFTDVYRPTSDRLFVGASVAVMVVRYEKSPALPAVCRDHVTKQSSPYAFDGGIVTFGRPDAELGPRLDDLATVHVGLVSGCEEVFANEEHANVTVMIANGRSRRYVLPSGAGDPVVEGYLRAHEHRLMSRRIRQFTGSNWFEWGGLRNINLMRAREGEPCVYIAVLTRSTTLAFLGEVQLFGAGLMCILPKPGHNMDLHALVDHLNSPGFRSHHTYSGRFRIGQRPLRFTRLPAGLSQD